MGRKLRTVQPYQLESLALARRTATELVCRLSIGGASGKLVADARRMVKRVEGALRHAERVLNGPYVFDYKGVRVVVECEPEDVPGTKEQA